MKPQARRFSGFTLIELMIALTIGLILLTVLSLIFVNNSGFRTELDQSSRSVENGSYALSTINADMRNAGYFAELDLDAVVNRPPQTLAPAPTIPIPTPVDPPPDICTTDATLLQDAFPVSVQGFDNVAGPSALPASCATPMADIKAGTDVLVVRRVETCAAGPTTAAGCDASVAGRYYLQASQCTPNPPAAATELAINDRFRFDTNTANLTLHKIECNLAPPGAIANYHRYLVDIYFVANNDNAGDGIPTLKMAQLDAVGGAAGFVVTPIAEGIENMQIEYGIDTAGSSNPIVPTIYVADPNSYNSCQSATPPDCVTANWLKVAAVKVHLLARNIAPVQAGIGYTATKTFTLGFKADGTANTFGPFNDRYKRHVYSASVRLNNPAWR